MAHPWEFHIQYAIGSYTKQVQKKEKIRKGRSLPFSAMTPVTREALNNFSEDASPQKIIGKSTYVKAANMP